MNKKFLSAILFGALAVASTGSFVSCKDYDDDIKNLQTQIGQLANKQDLQSQVSTLQSAISTAQSAAENKAAAAQKAADDAKAAAEAAAAKAATATTEAEKAAADAAAAKAAADAAASAADLKAAEESIAALKTSLEEVEALAATLVKTEDFEAAKQDLNDKYAALEAKMTELTGTAGLTSLQVLTEEFAVGYGVWNDANASKWDGPKAAEIAGYTKGQYVVAYGTPVIEIAVNPTSIEPSTFMPSAAIVNKYGDVAPISFGAIKEVTRANVQAGTYAVEVSAGKTDMIEKFKENFTEKDGNGASTAALKAGKIVSNYQAGLVDVVPNKNNSSSEFEAEVKYDEISNSVTLVAKNPELVLDAYIESLILANDDEKHDSLLFNLKYDKVNKGLILTYSEAAAKVLAAEGGKTFKANVKQINLNGYIHTATATIKFLPKEGLEPIEKEPVFVAGRTHIVKLDEKSPTTGKDQQIETLTSAQILEALGIEKGTDAYLHFMHSTYAVKLGKAFYRNVDDDDIELGEVGTATKNDDNSVTIKFAKNYDITKFSNADAKDFLTNGKKLYLPVEIKATDDADVEGTIVTNYTVIVPVTFEMPAINSLFTWKKNQTTGALEIYKHNNPSDNCNLSKLDSHLTYITGGHKKVQYGAATTDSIYAPELTAELDLTSVKSYNDSIKDIDKCVLGQKVNNVTLNTADDKDAYKAKLEVKYLNLVKANATKYVAKTSAAKPARWVSESTTPSVADSIWKVTVESGMEGDGKLLGTYYTYTVKGMKGMLLGREIGLGECQVVVGTPIPAAPTMTTTAAKVGENTFLYNSTAPAYYENNFAGSFTLKDKDGKVLNLADVEGSGLTITKAEWYNANDVKISTATTGIGMTTIDYQINADGVKATGINVKVTAAPENAVKVKIEFTVNNAKYNGTEATVTNLTGVKATFAL